MKALLGNDNMTSRLNEVLMRGPIDTPAWVRTILRDAIGHIASLEWREKHHITTDNTAVIAALEKRVEELETENARLRELITDIHDNLYGEVMGWDDGSDEWEQMRQIAKSVHQRPSVSRKPNE